MVMHLPETSRINPTTLIHRLCCAVDIDGTIYRAKATIKEYKDKNKANKPYAYEITEIELTDNPLLVQRSNRPLGQVDNSIPLAKILKGVEKSCDFGKKLLDAEYLAAVEAGDMATAARLVRQAAEAAGYNASNAYQGSLAFNGAAPSRNDRRRVSIFIL